MILQNRAPRFLNHYERLRQGLRINQLSALTGINTVYLSLIERGRLIPTKDELERIGRALNIPANAVMKHLEVVQPAAEVRA